MPNESETTPALHRRSVTMTGASINSQYQRTPPFSCSLREGGVFDSGRCVKKGIRNCRCHLWISFGKIYFLSPSWPGSFRVTRKFQITSLAFRSELVFPIVFSTSYCSPPGQVFPAPFTLLRTTCAFCLEPVYVSTFVSMPPLSRALTLV